MVRCPPSRVMLATSSSVHCPTCETIGSVQKLVFHNVCMNVRDSVAVQVQCGSSTCEQLRAMTVSACTALSLVCVPQADV